MYSQVTSLSTVLTLKALARRGRRGAFQPCEVLWLVTSKVEKSSTRNFVTFSDVKCRIKAKLRIFETCKFGHVT